MYVRKLQDLCIPNLREVLYMLNQRWAVANQSASDLSQNCFVRTKIS